MSNKSRNAIIIVLVVLLLGCVGGIGFLLMNNKSDSSKEDKETAQAMRYFEDADYENAILSYKEVLEKDDKNVDAYEGIAKAYAARNDYLTAIKWLDMGIEKTGSDRLRSLMVNYKIVFGDFGGELHAASDADSSGSGVSVYDDILRVISSYRFSDYAGMYTFSEYSTDNVIYVNEVPLTLTFTSAPSAESVPSYAAVRKIECLLPGYTSGLTYSALGNMGLEGLRKVSSDILGGPAVEFTRDGCLVQIQSDEEGNILYANPANVVFITGTAPGNSGENAPAVNDEPGDIAEDNGDAKTFKGFVYDAKSKNPAGTVHMEIYEGKQEKKGPMLKKLDTNTGGDFNVELPAGDYNAVISANGYITLVEDFTVRKTDMITVMDFEITKKSDVEGKYRIVLEWGANPADIDSHLRFLDSSGLSNSECFFGNKTVKDSSDFPVCTLDIDETNGNGRETTVIYDTSKHSVFYVHNFSGESPLGESGATIKIYKGEEQTPFQVLEIPADEVGGKPLWYVFEIKDGEIVIHNTGADSISELN